MERATVIRSNVSGSYSQKRISFIRDRDASFSSYLRPQEPKNNDDHDRENPGGSCTTVLDDSTEISIFDAQKYFNEPNVVEAQNKVINNGSSNNRNNIVLNNKDAPRLSSASSSIDGYSSISKNYRAHSFHVAATPTASSEASWNSQTGLLSVPPGTTMGVSLRNPLVSTEEEKKLRGSASSSSISTSFSATRWLSYTRKCPCSGKKSVQVKDKSLRSKTTTNIPPSPTPQPLSQVHVGVNAMEMLKSETASYKPLTKPHRHNHHSLQDAWVQKGTPPRRNCDQLLLIPKLQVQDRRGNGISSSSTSTGFSFPVLNVNNEVPPSSSSSCATVKLPVLKEGLLATTTNSVDDPPRDSLEVFRPPQEPSVSSRKSSLDFMRDRNTTFTVPTSPKSRTNNNDDDVASDASSDLFEIESFSTSQTTTTTTSATYPSMFHYHYCHRRDSLDEASTFQGIRRFGQNGVMMNMYCRRSIDEPMTPSTEYCYEPSIDWSVTTAEGFDRASVTNASEADHVSSAAMLVSEPEKSRKKSPASGLLSCRCEKAVSVGPQPVKLAASSCGGDGGGGSEGNRGNVGPGVRSASVSSTLGMWVVGTTAANKTPLTRSHSARLSLPFATS
ncbi:hypothetical protein FEM48_Zijuj12G0167000 [Ziziphus jujuba var. spinosa]|uniref:Protein PHYTOCHROME KINASE SUBSTRATE 4 n=1 Tax=Ziziphus jujuba var. spinosa TaxID=714518 RepID=A0A978UEG6_ZIZJJ|nr:hypothetical protein FEM48_Zijuj12G0167000 [Ziziphus jujuba var. spinosa]